MAVMTQAMHAHLQAQTHRILREASDLFARQISRTTTLPMSTLSNTTKFEITTPVDGAREWTLTVTLVEQSTPDGVPTTDHNVVTHG